MKSVFSKFASIVYSTIPTRGGVPTKNNNIIEEENKRVLNLLLLNSETNLSDSNNPIKINNNK